MYLTYRTLYTKQGTGNEPVQVGQHAMRGNKSRNTNQKKNPTEGIENVGKSLPVY